MRENDGIHFLWNGEGCVRVSPLEVYYQSPVLDATVDAPRWHHEYGKLPEHEIENLDRALTSKRTKVFQLKGYGRYQVVARGEFKNSE